MVSNGYISLEPEQIQESDASVSSLQLINHATATSPPVTDSTPLLIGSHYGLPSSSTDSYVLTRQRIVSPVISEDDDSITVRQPITYSRRQALPTIASAPELQDQQQHHQPVPLHHSTAFVSRLRYYNRLAPYSNSSLMMPNHVVPAEFYLVIPINIQLGKQSSLITIFSIWNTMMGTSILSMPWALEQAGFGCGIALMIFMAGLTLYTAYRVMTSPAPLIAEGLHNGAGVDFSNVCRRYLGRWAEIASIVFSLISLLGATIVYWVLMSNFLFHSVTFVHDKVSPEENTTETASLNNFTFPDVQCPSRESSNTTFVPNSMFDRIWTQYLSVPLFLVVFLFPLINFKSPTFFTKFNALGTISVAYILVFVCIKSAKWGFHLDFTTSDPLVRGIPQFKWTFPALTGVLSLAYFIHNAIISIVSNQRHPENNGRDLTVAYVCVAFTYIFVGVFFYSSFPLEKSCIEDNLLNNFRSSDILAFVARIFLFFQMMTVFPLLMYIFRIQVCGAVFGSAYPSLKHVILLNCCIIAVCILMAIFLPSIGTIIRFAGSMCGLVYVFALPSAVYLVVRRRQDSLNVPVVVIHVVIVVLGVLNFIAQFLILFLK